MKKPLFNLFYSLPVFRLTSKKAPKAAVAKAEAIKGSVTDTQKLAYIKSLQPRFKKLNDKAKEALNLKSSGVFDTNPKYRDFQLKLNGFLKRTKVKLLSDENTSAQKFIKFKAAVDLEFTKMEQSIENIKNKAFIAAELKRHFEETLSEYVKLVEDKNNPKAVNRKEILITAAAYLARWHNTNAKALAGLNNHATLVNLRSQFKNKSGEVFDDLKGIKKDININVIKKWEVGLNDDTQTIWRKVYKKGWEKRAIDKISDNDLKKRVQNFDQNPDGSSFGRKVHAAIKQRTIKEYVAYLIKQKVSNLPALPDGAKIGSIQGFDAKKIVASKTPAVAPSTPDTSPEVGSNKPKATGLVVKKVNGRVRLEIQGKNLEAIKVSKAELKFGKIDLVSNIGASVTDINLAKTSIDKFNLKRIEAVKDAVYSSIGMTHKFYLQVAKLFTNSKAKELTKAIFPTTKTVVKVRGTASMEGDLAENLSLAAKRAISAETQLRSKVTDFDKYYTVKRESFIVGPRSDIIKTPAQLKAAKETMIGKFNQTKGIVKKIKTWKEMLSVLKKPSNPQEAKFIKYYFNDVRGASLQFFKPKSKDQSFDVAAAASKNPRVS